METDVCKTEAKLNRKKRKAFNNRKKLKKSGLDVFAEKGLYETSIEDITETADLGKGTFYSHFDNKEALFIELLEDSTGELIDIIKNHCVKDNAGGLEQVLERLLDAHFDFFKEYYGNFIIIFQGQGMLSLQKDDEKEVIEPMLDYIQTIETCLQSYTKSIIPAKKLRKLACALAGFVTGYFSFANIGLNENEIESTLAPMKAAFIEALSAFINKV